MRDAARQLSEGRAKTERLERAQEALIAERNQALDEVHCSGLRSCFYDHRTVGADFPGLEHSARSHT